MLLFAGNFLRHPYMLGSIIPSSRFLVNQVLEPIDWEPRPCDRGIWSGYGHDHRARSCAACIGMLIWWPSRPIAPSYASCQDLTGSAPACGARLRRAGAAGSAAARTPGAGYIISGIPLGQHAGCGAHRHRRSRVAPRSSPAVHFSSTSSPPGSSQCCSEPSATCGAASSGATSRRRSCSNARRKGPEGRCAGGTTLSCCGDGAGPRPRP